MVRPLAALFEQANLPACIPRGSLQHHPEILVADRLRTRTGDEESLGIQEAKPAEIHFLVTGQGMGDRLLTACKSRRVKNDHIISLMASLEQTQFFKRIGLTIPTPGRHPVFLGVGLGQGYGCRADV